MDDETQKSQPSDDVKAKFREALERKKQNQQSRTAHLDGGSAIQGPQAKTGGKREFRRKSG